MSNLVQQGGGENISLVSMDIQGRYTYPSLYVYEKKTDSPFLTNFNQNYYILNLLEDDSYTLTVPNLNPIYTNTSAYIMCYISGITQTNKVIINTSAGGTLTGFNRDLVPNTSSTSAYDLQNEMTILKLDNSATDLTFKFSNPDQKGQISLIISNPRYVKGINPLLGLKEHDDIINFISNNSSSTFGNSKIFEKFYAINYIDTAKAIEVSKDYPLNNALSFYDYNNIGNK